MIAELKNLHKTYRAPDGGDEVKVLDGVNLALAEGESVSIVGPSGSGKSTILNLLGALDRPDAGEIIVDGRHVGLLKEAELASYRNTTIGFIFQLHHLLPQCSVLENVLVPALAGSGAASTEAERRAISLLESVGLSHRLHHRPGQLSGGERQRVAVARALINRPKLLLADEPTGALDQVSATHLIDLLVELNRTQKVTLVLVTHAPDLARRMQRIIELRQGQLVETSPAS